MNRIEWTTKAARQLRKLPHAAQIEIRDAVTKELASFPRCKNVKKLSEHAIGYRLRVGHYRVLFNFDGVIRLILIEEVKKRDERTY